MEEIKVRSLKLSDLEPATNYLAKSINSTSTYKHLTLKPKKIARLLSDILFDDSKCGYVALKDGKIIGMVGGYLSTMWFSDTLVLNDFGIFVDEKYRNTGVSYKLLYEFFNFGKESKANEIHFSVTAEPKYFSQLYNAFTKKFEFELMGIVLRRK
tara:strand:- start:15619 stop:16083 length:465 start_codon:yes stop_codon:yes gene_type:complete